MTQRTLDTDVRREQLVFDEAVDWDDQFGGIKRFKDLPPETARALIDENYVDPDGGQNRSPTMDTLVTEAEQFESKHVTAGLNGYIVSPDRHDARVSFEGIQIRGNLSMDEVTAFTNQFGGADELTTSASKCRAWWD